MSARNQHINDDSETSSNRIRETNEFPWSRKPRRKLTGLLNQGGTCYLNTLLQTLLHAPEFTYRLFKLAREVGKGNLKRMIQEMLNLFSALITNGGGAISSKPLTDSFGWTDEEVCVHQDIQELNRLLFEQIEIALKNTPESSLINDLFRGIQCTRIRCLKCGRISERNDEFQDINLSVMEHDSVEDCLAAHTQMEQLTGDNKYFCEGCKMKVDAIKMTRFAELPPILTISLSRFYFDAKLMQSVKLEKMCSFPLILDMSSFLINKPYERMKYDLFSVVLHVGGSTRGGHYHAYIKDPYGTAEENNRDNSSNNEFDQLVGVMCSETTYQSRNTSSGRKVINNAGESLTETVEESFKKTFSSSTSYCHQVNQRIKVGTGDEGILTSLSEKQIMNQDRPVTNTNLTKRVTIKSDKSSTNVDDLCGVKKVKNKSPNESKIQDSQITEDTSCADIQSHLLSGNRTSNCATITEMVGRMCLTRKVSTLSNLEHKRMLYRSSEKKIPKAVGNLNSKVTFISKKSTKRTSHISNPSVNVASPISNKTSDAVTIYPAKSRVQSADSIQSRSHSLNLSSIGISDLKACQTYKQNLNQATRSSKQSNHAHPPVSRKTVRKSAISNKIGTRSNGANKTRMQTPQANQHNIKSERSDDSSSNSSSVRFPTSFDTEWHSKVFDSSRRCPKDMRKSLPSSYDANPGDTLESTDYIEAKCFINDNESLVSKHDSEWIPSIRRSNAQLMSRPSDIDLVSSTQFNMMIQPGSETGSRTSSKSVEMEQLACTENDHLTRDVMKNVSSRHYATSTTHNECNDTRGYSRTVFGRWFDINDDCIAEVDPSTFDRVFEGPECAYMLFYRLINLPLPISTL